MSSEKHVEIMAPIRGWSSLEACKNHADAVYFGLSDLTMRANANTFTLKNIGKLARLCRHYKIKSYLALNSVIYNKNISRVETIMKKARDVEIDAVIVWDPAVIQLAKIYGQKFFISTQANVSNYASVQFYKDLGASRIVLAREMSLKQITEVKKRHPDIEIEVFVHGAMCMSISGRCILSAYLEGKSANCGACSQPCRREWTLTDDRGKQITNEGHYFLSAKDLCMIDYVPELLKAGIDSFKIEGRMRDPRYVETTSRCYKEAVHAVQEKSYTPEKVAEWKNQLKSVYNRGFSSGFYFGTPGPQGINYNHSGNISTTKKVLAGKVVKYYQKIGVAEIAFDSRGLKLGETICIEGNSTFLEQKVESMQVNGDHVKRINKGFPAGVKVDKVVRRNDLVFVMVERRHL